MKFHKEAKCWNLRRYVIAIGAVFCFAAANQPAHADDWGAYAIVPSSAPGMTLEVVGSAKTDGAIVSIGRAANTPNQKWTIEPKGNDLYAIHPSYSNKLSLAAAKGGSQNGTQIVLEEDRGEPWQLWNLKKNENGSYCIIPKHAPLQGLDDFGGHREPGSTQDLWANSPGDSHLMWLIRPLAGSVSTGVAEKGTDYVAPEIKPTAILEGQVKVLTFSHSRIYPGTVRQVSVFVPAQYDGSKPACVYVKTDGYNPYEKQLLERMIATKEVPVMIGIFITPGDTPANIKDTMGRRNRDLEYDGMGNLNVRFLTEEILPFVTREFGVKLSTSGNDRCISGGSSGAIAAFNAAWERPDAFSRVYANSGSFVAFRGGHEFPTLVRKFEPKPIRAYLTTGTGDMENAAGDWFLLDQEMDKALKFSGYDYFFRIINGGHVAGYYDYYQEAMAYIWKGWPAPVKSGTGAPRVRDVILPDQPWKTLDWRTVSTDPGGNTIGGAAVNADGEVFFIDHAANKILRIDVNEAVHEFIVDAGHASCLTVGPKGELYAVSEQTGKVLRYDASGKAFPIAEAIRGEYIVAMPNGSLYVTTNHATALNSTLSPAEGGEVWLIKDGKKTRVAAGLKHASGLTYRPDQWLLNVAERRSKWATSYQIEPDGTLINGERYFWLHVPDWQDDADTHQVCYAKEGQILFATSFGVQICADDGPTQVILPLPTQTTPASICLGGKEMDTLYAFSGGTIWKRKVKIHGIGAFTPWMHANGSPL